MPYDVFLVFVWQSIRQSREFFYFKSIEDMFSNARRRFMDSVQYHKNDTLRFLSQLLRETEENERSKVPRIVIFYIFFPSSPELPLPHLN